jgi:tetratricopeptide (TPR) repeat protein
VPAPAPAPNPQPVQMPRIETPKNRWLLRLALLGLTLLAHGSVCTHDFVDMDDPQTLYTNPLLNPPSLRNTLYYWKHGELQLYIPVTYTVWSITAAFSGGYHGAEYSLRPFGFHLVSLCFHLMSVLVVFEILRLFLESAEPAAIGAALFAVHPLQVEAVAWASGTKDVLFGLAALVAIWQYLMAIAQRGKANGPRISRTRYVLATIAFAIALLAKPAAVAAIGIVVVLDCLVFRARLRQVLYRLLPWIVLGAAIAIIARREQPAIAVADNPWLLRPLIALDALSFYVWKLCWPAWLSPDYGRRPTWVIDQGYIAWAWAIPFALGWLAWSYRGRSRLLFAGAAVSLGGLMPTLGLIPFVYQTHSTVADHYVYLAMLGPAMMLGWCVCRYGKMRTPSILVIAVLAVVSIRQEALWSDSLHLFAHAVDISPEAPFNHLNYGVALAADGRFDEAAQQFRQTLALAPQNPQARANLELLTELRAKRLGAQPGGGRS